MFDRWFAHWSYSDIRNDTVQNLLSLYLRRVYKFTHVIGYVYVPEGAILTTVFYKKLKDRKAIKGSKWVSRKDLILE